MLLAAALTTIFSCMQDLRTVILINCGATRYAHDYIDSSKTTNVRFIIFDSHRPIDPRYDNEEDTTAVLVLDDREAPGGSDAVPMPKPEVMELLAANGPDGKPHAKQQLHAPVMHQRAALHQTGVHGDAACMPFKLIVFYAAS